MQDTFQFLSNMAGGAGEAMYSEGGKGPLKRSASVAGQAMGNLGGAFSIAQQYSPYIAKAQQSLGLRSFDPLSTQARGMSAGLAGGPHVGIGGIGFQSPIGLQSSFPFVNVPEAVQQGYGQTVKQFTTGLAPGISTKTAGSLQDYLTGEGFKRLEEQNPFVDAFKLATDKTYANGEERLPTTEISGELMTQMARYGNTTEENVAVALTEMADAAGKAKISIDDMGQATIEFVNWAKTKGATPSQAVDTAIGFTNATGLRPDVLSTVADQPNFQGMLGANTGIYQPELQGLALQDMGMVLKTFQDVDRLYSGLEFPKQVLPGVEGFQTIISSKEQAEAFKANQMGFPSVEQYREAKEAMKAQGARGTIEQMRQSQRDIEKGTGIVSKLTPAEQEQLRSSPGAFDWEGKFNKRIADREEIMKFLNSKRVEALDIDEEDIERVRTATSARGRKEALDQLLANLEEDKGLKSETTVDVNATIGLTDEAREHFQVEEQSSSQTTSEQNSTATNQGTGNPSKASKHSAKPNKRGPNRRALAAQRRGRNMVDRRMGSLKRAS
jgi:hypothetical protein